MRAKLANKSSLILFFFSFLFSFARNKWGTKAGHKVKLRFLFFLCCFSLIVTLCKTGSWTISASRHSAEVRESHNEACPPSAGGRRSASCSPATEPFGALCSAYRNALPVDALSAPTVSSHVPPLRHRALGITPCCPPALHPQSPEKSPTKSLTNSNTPSSRKRRERHLSALTQTTFKISLLSCVFHQASYCATFNTRFKFFFFNSFPLSFVE